MARLAKAQPAPETPEQAKSAKRVRVSQSDVPAHTLDDALRVVFAISNEYGMEATRPVDVATALQLLPTTGHFKTLTGAAVAYGIADGGAQAEMIEVTDLGQRIVAPTEEGDDLAARREALLRPRVVREFLQKYDGSPLPSETIALNVLQSMGVPRERAAKTHHLVVSSAESLGLLGDINGSKVVNLRAPGARLRVVPQPDEEGDDPDADELDPTASQFAPLEPKGDPTVPDDPYLEQAKNRRVFRPSPSLALT